MSSPTSTPKPLPTGKERKLKLRASCDACAASKVKCSKEHPNCARCLTNGSPCVYGVSRKHGKPGRTRKRNPDGTPFVKASKQRPVPSGRQSGRFKAQPEATFQQLPDMEIASEWASDWSPTPSLPATPEFDFDMTPEPFFMDMDLDSSSYSYMDDFLPPTVQLESASMRTGDVDLVFRDPFAKRQSVLLNLPSLQALQDYLGGDFVNPQDYGLTETTTMSCVDASTSASTPQSPKSQLMGSYDAMPMRLSISLPTTHCCYSLAYSTLETLNTIDANATRTSPTLTQESFDSSLTITKLAVESILQLLSCSCSSDPHLAMLYSSIASKMLAWYRVAAGTSVTTTSTASSQCSNNSTSSTPSTSGFASPLITPSVEQDMPFDASAYMQSLHLARLEVDMRGQERQRRQAVLCELNKCGELVEVLANWRGEGTACEQAEFLYDILGAWLKSELYKTVKEVEAMDTL